MLDDGAWCTAQDLTGKYIKCGITYPEDVKCSLEKYVNFYDRQKILATARIVGYISSRRFYKKAAWFCNNTDLNNFISDMSLISELFTLEYMGVLLEDSTITKLKEYIWTFMSDQYCPTSIIREFLAGLCSGDSSDITETYITIKSKYNIEKLLERFAIDVHESNKITDIELFSKTIGFRYSIGQSYILCITSSYLRSKSPFSLADYISETKSEDCFTDFNSTPTYRQRVLSVTPHTPVEVFDIEVHTAHNFLANGAVAHNCSLYPTTIIAYNLCWSTLVSDEKIPDNLCHVMEWSDHQGCQHDPKVVRKTQLNEIIKKREAEIKEVRVARDLKRNKDKKPEFEEKIKTMIKDLKPLRDERSTLNKSKPKHIICCERRFRWLKSPKGVLPEILSHLLDTRAATKKEMKGVKAKLKEMKDSGVSEDDPAYSDLATYYDVLDQRQLALKVSANSGYGATGTQKGYLPCMPVAMCTTYMGRKAIEKAAESIQKDHGGHLVYGDSVTPATPILCRYEGLLLYKTIDTISNGNWKPYHGDKEVSTPLDCTEVWTERGFTLIQKVIRHKCHKKIYRVMTTNGAVHVTEDHSLLNTHAEKITPKDLHIGSEILVSKFPEVKTASPIFSEYNAYLLGVNFKNRKEMLNIVLNDTFKNRKAFMEGFSSVNLIYYCDTQKNLAPIYFIAKSVGYNVVINTTANPDIYSLTFSKENVQSIDNKINRLELYSDCYTDFVYDLETENHHFSAGVGEIIVHNTDSNYVSFPDLTTTAECWDHAIHVAKVVSQLFPKPINICQVGNRGFEKNVTL
jgi:intein/homing endonuclease